MLCIILNVTLWRKAATAAYIHLLRALQYCPQTKCRSTLPTAVSHGMNLWLSGSVLSAWEISFYFGMMMPREILLSSLKEQMFVLKCIKSYLSWHYIVNMKKKGCTLIYSFRGMCECSNKSKIFFIFRKFTYVFSVMRHSLNGKKWEMSQRTSREDKEASMKKQDDHKPTSYTRDKPDSFFVVDVPFTSLRALNITSNRVRLYSLFVFHSTWHEWGSMNMYTDSPQFMNIIGSWMPFIFIHMSSFTLVGIFLYIMQYSRSLLNQYSLNISLLLHKTNFVTYFPWMKGCIMKTKFFIHYWG